MAVEFKLPDLGENVESADVADVLVSPGDTIEKDQSVIEAETEKAVMEIPCTIAGKVAEVKVKKGDTVQVGQLLLTVEEQEAGAEAAPKAEEPPAEEAKPAAGEQGAEQQAAPAATATAEAPAQAEAKEAPAQQPAAPAEPAGGGGAPSGGSGASGGAPPVAAAPSVRQFAREIGIDVHNVPGSGPGGRISIEDVKTFARSRGGGNGAVAGGGAAAGPRVQREPMSKVRRITAETMAKAWTTVPHVTVDDKADVTDLEAVRQQHKKRAEAMGGRLTVTAIFVKLAAAALKAYPNVNASIDTEAGEVEYHNYYNIGVAVDTPRGLLVPVINDVDQKSVFDIAVELTETSKKARDGKLTPDEMSGGTFTITNLGSIGTGHFTPIVTPPQVAILGMGRARQEPVYIDGQFQPRQMAPLSLSFDHRLVDGADGARFLRYLVNAVEQPLMMALDG